MKEEIEQLEADKQNAIDKGQTSAKLILKYQNLISIHKDIIKQSEKTVNWIEKTISKMKE